MFQIKLRFCLVRSLDHYQNPKFPFVQDSIVWLVCKKGEFPTSIPVFDGGKANRIPRHPLNFFLFLTDLFLLLTSN